MAQNEPKDGKWRPFRGWRIREVVAAPDAAADDAGAVDVIDGSQSESDNPWLLLHSGDRNAVMPPLENSVPKARVNRPVNMAANPPVQPAVPAPRWGSEGGSPYGFSDEDGSLKQGDADTWRRAFSGTYLNPEQAVGHSGPAGRPPKRTGVSGPSTWFLQVVAAAAIVVVGLYSAHHQSTTAADIRGVYQTAFTQDQGSTLWQRTQQFLSKHHLGIPLLSSSFGAIHLHVPLAGTVIQDYSTGQPEMVIQGNAGEHVLAAGSGTVTKIAAIKGEGNLIEINHGSIGTSWYTGVVKPAVRVNEYVTAGEVIGALPAQPKHPTLQFALEKNNQFENPHDYIVFPGPAKSG